MTLIGVQIFELAKLSVREAFRKKFVYSVLVITILFLILDFSCERNFNRNINSADNSAIDLVITFFFVSFWNMLISLMIPSALVADELENKTYVMILSGPVHRLVYLLGKSFGILFLVLTNLLFVLSFYTIVNFSKTGIPLEKLWMASGTMVVNYLLLILFVVFLTIHLNRTAALMGAAGLVIFSTFIDMNYAMSLSGNETLELWKQVAYWVLPQFGSVFLFSTSMIVKSELYVDNGWNAILHSIAWLGVLLVLLNITFNRKELN